MTEGETVAEICASPDMPHRSTITDWKNAHAEFAVAYAQARENLAHACADNAVRAAKRRSGDSSADRLEFDALRWFAGKMNYAAYGDKQQISGDAANPLTITIRTLPEDG